MIPNKMIKMDQGGPESLRSEPFIKKEDIPVIVGTLVSGNPETGTGNNALEKSTVFGNEWSLLLPIAIDLRLDVNELQAIKDGLESGSVTDAEGLSQILSSWIDKLGNEATWIKLISVFSSNIRNYQRGILTKDYVGLLTQLNPDKSDDQRESRVVKTFQNDLIRNEILIRISFDDKKGIQLISPQVHDQTGFPLVKAFQTDLIRKEILKRISFDDKENLRLVSRQMHDAMLRDWREELALLTITANEAGQFETFFGHFDEAEDGKFKEGSGKFETPFLGYHFYDINSLKLYDFQPIWINYGAKMTQLDFSNCDVVTNLKVSEMLKWLLLGACPNLVSLRFLDDCYHREDETESKMCKLSYPVGAVAEKLKTLQFNPDMMMLEREEPRQIIEIIPNIENLRVSGLEFLEGLMLSAGQPETVKLHTLTVDLEMGDSFDLLQRFTSHYPGTLKDLSLLNIGFLSPALLELEFLNLLYSFYLGIGQCTSLASLVLEFFHWQDNWDWITLLSTMEFPLLKTFEIEFPQYRQHIKFDFTALKGMPQLKSLSVTTLSGDKTYKRLPGSADYICEGPLSPFIPSGKIPFKEHPQDSPIYLEHLQKFKFNLWRLEASDLGLLSQWFPNLRILQAELNLREWSGLKKFSKLEMLVLPHRDETCLMNLKEIKEGFKNLRVIVKYKNGEAEVKLGEDGKAYLIEC